MKTENREIENWGFYAPSLLTKFYLLFVKAGLGRGLIRKLILKRIEPFNNGYVDIARDGIKWRLNIRDNVTDRKILASSKTYDKTELDYLKAYTDDGAFVDVGANTGYYSLHIARFTDAKAISIEPNPSALERLYFNIKANPFAHKIAVVPLGIGAAGSTPLYTFDGLGSTSMHATSTEAAKATNTTSINVETASLLSILENQNVRKIDSLKIDIEGMEDQALVPFLTDAPVSLLPKCIVFEHNHKHLWKTDVFEILKDKKYEILYQDKSNAVAIRAQETLALNL